MGTILLSALLAGCSEGKERDKADAAAPQPAAPAKPGEFDMSERGKPAPELAFELADGGTFRLADKRTAPTLVNLWATWCAPCIAEMPALDRLAKAQRERLLVVGVSQDLQGWDKVRPFVEKAGLQAMTIALDKDGRLASALGAAGLPVTVLYDADGREVWRVSGPREWDQPGGFVASGKPAPAARFRAIGQEPGWTMDIVPGDKISVVADYGEKRATFDAPASFNPDATALSISGSGQALAVNIRKNLCTDVMSGKPFAYTVSIELDGSRYEGCGENVTR